MYQQEFVIGFPISADQVLDDFILADMGLTWQIQAAADVSFLKTNW